MQLRPMKYAKIEGTEVMVHVTTPFEAKAAIKELRHRKKELGLLKKRLLRQQRDARTALEKKDVAQTKKIKKGGLTGMATRLSLVFLQYPAGSVTLTRVGGTETLTASNFTIDSAGVLRIVGTAPYTIGIGATLSVPSTAVEGSYLGTFTLTANYF